MKITCHSCAAKYTVSDEKVQGKTVKMKCRKCGATIVVGGSQQADASPQDEATAVGGAEGGADLAAGSFLVNVNDGDQRTMTLQELVDAYRSGVVNGDTYIWSDGMTDWQPVSENATVTGALGGNGSNGSNGGGYGATEAASPIGGTMPMMSSPLAAAAKPVDDVRPAARRDSNRRSGDLFGGGMSDGGGLSSSLSSSAGKRDENSVLFSLSALTASAPAPTKSSTTTATKEDSGLIDLKALAAAPAAPVAATAPVIENVGLFPLGAPVLTPPPAAAPIIVAPEPVKKSNSAMMIVFGVLAVGGISAAVFMAVKSGGTPTPTSTAVAQNTGAPTTDATNVAPTPTQPTATPPTTQAAPPTTVDAGTASAATTAGTPPPGGHLSGKLPPAAGSAKPVTPPATTTPGPTKPPTSTCSCPPGDLMCAMQKCAGRH